MFWRSLAHRIKAAGVEGMAAQQPAETHADTSHGAIFIDRIQHVFRTRGRIAAR